MSFTPVFITPKAAAGYDRLEGWARSGHAVVAAPGYLENKPASTQPADVTGHRCINYKMVTAGSLYAWGFEKGGKPLEVSVFSGPLTCNEPEVMLSAALDGVGVGYLLEHEVAPYLESGKLVRLSPTGRLRFLVFIYIIRRDGRCGLS